MGKKTLKDFEKDSMLQGVSFTLAGLNHTKESVKKAWGKKIREAVFELEQSSNLKHPTMTPYPNPYLASVFIPT